MNTAPAWDDNLTQFARLIEESNAAGAFTPDVMADLTTSMDLPRSSVDQLIDRAAATWAAAKAARPLAPAGGTRHGIVLSPDQLDEWAGWPLTDTQLAAIAACVPRSTIPDVIATIASQFDDRPDDGEDDGETGGGQSPFNCPAGTGPAPIAEPVTVTLSADAAAVIAGLVAPTSQVNPDGIDPGAPGVWDEIRTAFPASMFWTWADEGDDPDAPRYNPDAGT